MSVHTGFVIAFKIAESGFVHKRFLPLSIIYSCSIGIVNDRNFVSIVLLLRGIYKKLMWDHLSPFQPHLTHHPDRKDIVWTALFLYRFLRILLVRVHRRNFRENLF